VVIDVMPDWNGIRREWESSSLTFKELADKHGLSDATIRSRKNREKWQRRGATQREDATQRMKRVATPKQTRATKAKPLPEPEIENDDLTDKQRLFVMEYMRDFNATRAAMAAGYSKRSAYSEGWRLLNNAEIQAEIKRLKEDMADNLALDIRRIIAEYMKIAFTDVTDLLEFGQREVPVMSMFGPMYEGEGDDKKPVMKTVNYVDFKDHSQVDGTVIAEVKQGKDGVSIKLHDKMRALEKLEKYTDFMTEEQLQKVAKLRGEVALIEQQVSRDDAKPIEIRIVRKGERS
jgi:phage terminase small subunit